MNARLNIKTSVKIPEQIIRERAIDNAHLFMILSKIEVSQHDKTTLTSRLN